MPNVLIGSAPIRNRPGPFRDLLHDAGFRTVDPDCGEILTEAAVRASLPSCEAIIAGGEPLPADLIAIAPGLRVIARTGVGFDSVDVAAATARRIAVTITPGTNEESVAEHAFALLLGVSRRIALNDRLIRSGSWDRTLVIPLRGKTLGLLGLGRIGRAMVPRARAFGMSVIACDPLPNPGFDAEHGLRRCDLDALLAEADVLSLHVPLTPSTRNLLDADALERMKPGSIVINTARGGIIDESALVAALRRGHLAGAGLDVFAVEPPPDDHPLLSLPNVVASPHLGGIDTLAMSDMATLAARCIVDLQAGRWPSACVVNPEIAEGWRW